MFTRSGSSWKQQGEKLVGVHASGLTEQGSSVALSGDGDIALIGGPFSEGETGAAWIFTRSGSTWTEQGKLPTGTGAIGKSAQGESVALSADGTTALVGGPLDDKDLGAAWVYTRSGSTWTQQGEKLLGEDAVTGPEQGSSVSLSEDGDSALVGGPKDNISVGAAWEFTRSDSTWSEDGPKLVGTGTEGGFAEQGHSVALSADGDTALIGGPADDGKLGAAWVFAMPGQPGSEPEKEMQMEKEGSKEKEDTGNSKGQENAGNTDTGSSGAGSNGGGGSGGSSSGGGSSSVGQQHTALECTLEPTGSTVSLPLQAKRKGKSKAKAKANTGVLVTRVECNQAAKVTLSGTLVELLGKRPKHGKQRSKVYQLGPLMTSVQASTETTLDVKLPSAALDTLAHMLKASVTLTLIASGAGGGSRATATIRALKTSR